MTAKSSRARGKKVDETAESASAKRDADARQLASEQAQAHAARVKAKEERDKAAAKARHEGAKLQEVAELAHQSDDPDPWDADLNRGYIEQRDPVIAAHEGESPTSSGPDDFGARAGAQVLKSQALHEAVLDSHEGRPENAGQHAVAGEHAERGVPYPVVEDPPIVQQGDRDKETAKSEKHNEKEAVEFAKRKLNREKPVVPRNRSDVPQLPGVFADMDMQNPTTFVESMGRPMNIGALVSRLDHAHDYLGVIIRREDPIEAGLVIVYFPNEGEKALNVCNLRYEGESAEFSMGD